MRPFSALLVFLCIVLVLNEVSAREGPREEFWKRVMEGEAMPEAIKGLFGADDSGLKLVKDFETKSNVIIYHGSHDEHAAEKHNALVQNHEA